MKVLTVNYDAGGIALEIVGETDVEIMVLHQIFKHGEMSKGNGSSVSSSGGSVGFYLKPEKKQND